ncbi:hypothetical protein ACG04R_27795 [Roseateles sp. BYS78W]|uniref:Uncharacterized protein n=1 Tax=Pelomonas candidula TaxID=3299025 RepID=A0ABW7HKT9_9BURK
MMKNFFALVVCVLPLYSGAQTLMPECSAEDSVIYLESIRVTNCLVKGIRSDGVTTEFAQRIENVGKQEVVLELLDSYFVVSLARIYLSGSRAVLNKDPTIANGHDAADHANEFPSFKEVLLKSGESVIFRVLASEILSSPPINGQKYTVFMRSDVPFRRPAEPRKQGASLRMKEEIKSGRVVQDSMFEGVALR